MYKDKILKQIDNLDTFDEKMELLNRLFLNSSGKDDEMLLEMMQQLKEWG